MKPRRMAVGLAVALAFALTSAAQNVKFKVLHNFAAFGSGSEDGTIPYGPLVLDPKGNLYGVTIDGGMCSGSEYGCGTVYELGRREDGSWAEKILHSFTAGSDGDAPWGSLLLDSSGSLYGTIQGDLSFAVGGVFELSNSDGGWSNTVLYSDGAGPGLLPDSLGNLYGQIGPGDYFGLGAIGELSPGSDGWTYTQLYSFTCQPNCAGGYDLPAPPIWDGKGNLWGAMTYGGQTQSRGWGVIFEMTPNGDGTWTYNVVHEFGSSSTDGQYPIAGLTLDAAGNFYGETEDGGTHSLGIIFKFSVTDGKLKGSIIHNFSNCSTGCYPEGTLAIDSTGNLYGMAQGGTNSCGGLSCGVVFKLAPQTNGTWKYSVVYNLSETTGGVLPFYGLILDSKDNLYGVTSSGGQYGGGTAFEITP